MSADRKRLLALLSLAMGLVGMAGNAIGQQAPRTVREQLVGTWTLASFHSVRQDGSRFDMMGTSPEGMLMYDASGRMSVQIMRTDRLKFAKGNRLEGTPEENQSAVPGTIAYHGKYTVNKSERTVTHHIERSLFPNWDGVDQKRFFTLEGDELKLSTPPIPTAGGVTAVGHLVWKRAK